MGGETVEFKSASGGQIVGWLTETEDASGAILLLHAIRADRRSMAHRARFLRDQGYHTLCIDFQAHGESPGEKITLGHLEAMDAAAGVAYGSEDRHARPVEANAIYAALGGPKELWKVAGAAHVDLHRFAGAEYEERVGKFIANYLGPKAD